jgi:hypothetical protein
MPSVVTFWQLPSDHERFVEYLCRSGEPVGWPRTSFDSREAVISMPLSHLLIEQKCSDVLFCAPEFVGDQAPREVETDEGMKFLGRDQMDDNVLGYSVGEIKPDGALTQSNMFAYWERLTPDHSAVVRKEEEFIRWGQRVFRWLRKHAGQRQMLRGYEYPCTADAKAAFDRGELRAVTD